MNLPEAILQEFAKATNDTTQDTSEKVVYGTYTVDQNGKAFVNIDGSQSPTPVANAMDAQSGDRVTVMIKGHQATVTGNLTSPASARSATSYMKFTNDGLIVGGLDNSGNPTGPYVVIGSSSFTVKSASGETLATFSTDIASIASGEGIMRVFNSILFLIGKVAVGVRSSFVSGNTTYYSEIVSQSGSTSSPPAPIASLQVRNDAATPTVSSVVVSFDGVRVNTPSGKTLYVNSSPVLQENNVMAVGAASMGGNLNGGTRYDFAISISNMPTGYILTGIRSINVTDQSYTPRVWFKLIRFVIDPDRNSVTVTVANTDTSRRPIRVTVQWFAIRNSGAVEPQIPEYIDLGDIGDE